MTAVAAVSPGPTSSLRPWQPVLRYGLLGGVVAVYLCLVGIVPAFNERPLVAGVISLGQASLLLTALVVAYVAATRAPSARREIEVLAGALAGGISGSFLAALVLVGAAVNLRTVLLHASPELYETLTFGLGTAGFWVPIAVGAVAGAVAALTASLPVAIRLPIVWGFTAVVVMGLFAGLLRTPALTTPLAPAARFLFAPEGLTVAGAVIVFALAAGAAVIRPRLAIRRRYAQLPAGQQRALLPPAILLLVATVLVLPLGLGPFFAQVVAIVAIYVLMGFGMNITLGLAGLLDLGFVAFFAVGAYTVGLLTSTGEFGLAGWPWWAAVPFAVLFAMMFAAFLGLPILRIRGDYLAIATLGFGEIVRIMAGSDLLKPWLGGPQGILNIPKPIPATPDQWWGGPVQIYYIALACAVVVAFVAWRLRGSRLGRSWMAIREDEDVAESTGINLVQTKLLAYMLGGAFAGLGGAVFAGLVGSIFASSMQLFVSINVVALVVVGGMGSNPGVVVGAIFLIGLPELFREFAEYRFLFYGVALIAMMLYRPEGLLPSKITRRELHAAEELEATADSAVPGAGAAANPEARR
ncbi:MAG: branched-chain amino acid ABC transporter permease [Chloroflexi bacterium]|jgi:branched-chain amino acid transport system permease protein|nr:branched-chain amino acid ABC transporter permease [Chloroflexota bacterium]